MSDIISYAHLQGQPKRDAALVDLFNFVGPERAKTLVAEAERVERERDERGFEFLQGLLHFCGVEGYPITAFCEQYCPTLHQRFN